MKKSSLKISLLVISVLLLAGSSLQRREYRMNPIYKEEKDMDKIRERARQNSTSTPIPEKEDEITLELFKHMHDQGNWTKKFPIFKLTKHYFPEDKEINITKKQFVNLARDYIVEDLIATRFNLTFNTIVELQSIFKHIFRDHFTDVEAKEMSFEDVYRYTIGGSLGRLLHYKVVFEDLPQQLQEAIKEMHENDPSDEIEDLMGYRRSRPKPAKVLDLKEKEIKRKFKERYEGIEWMSDGRRVIDDDYDDLEPAYERKLHMGRINREKLSEDEIDILLEEDL